MSDDRFYPTLSEEGEKEAQELIDLFKIKMKHASDEILGKLYCDVVCHISSDSWQNYRNSIMSGFRDYKNASQNEYDFKDIRQQIFKEFREEIIQDLNQDLIKEIENLKDRIKWLNESRVY